MRIPDQLSCRHLFLLLCVAWMPIGCGPVVDPPGRVLDRYFDAVQSEDFGRLYCLMAGAAEAPELGQTPEERRTTFEGWARAYYDSYEFGRDEGWVDFDEQGLALVKMLSLGRGAFVTHGRLERLGESGARLESRVRPAYAHIDLSPYPSGTTFYLCGDPLGRMHALQIPYDSRELSADVLETITLSWSLIRREPSEQCAGGWAVAGVAAVADSLETTEVMWKF
jgi:hypothetical protein